MQPRDPAEQDETAEQPTLDLGLDLPEDEPIPFRLTATGRREVAAEAGPGLHALGESEPTLPDPADPRRARARALRRAGRPLADIAAALDLDPDVVSAWTAGLRSRTARRHLRAVGAPAATTPDGASGDGFEQATTAAHQQAIARLTSRQFVRGVALVAGAAEVSRHGLLVGVADEAAAHRIVSFLRGAAGTDPSRIRVILRRVDTAADLAAHRWAQTLALPVSQVGVAGADAPGGHAALIRVACPQTAAKVLGWRRALLETDDLDLDALGLAF